MHFGFILGYTIGGRVSVRLNKILWELKNLITQFNIMVKDIENVSK